MRHSLSAALLYLLALTLLLPFSACGEGSETLYVKKVENLPEDFIFGMDVSSLIAEEESGVRYFDFDGQEKDLLEILAANGVTHIRVRVWNDPYDAEGHGYGGGNNDIDKAVLIGQRATKYGMKLIVDFHYSDFWADPGKQMAPKAWKGMEIEEKTQAAYEFTRDCLQKLRDAGVDVGMVQTGNETNNRLSGEKTWFNIQYIMQAGAKATREIYPEALVALHFANPEKVGSYMTYASKMAYYNVDYDVFATSYYPYWHGTLDNLAAVLSEVAETYGKKVMVMETSWAYTGEDSDFSGNTIGEGGAFVKDYPFTVQGQATHLRALTDTIVNRTVNGIGVCYWEGAWITVGGAGWEENHEKWETYGSGWASSYAAEYDPNDAGKYYGGSAVDNQAFFTPEGKAQESLKVFRLMRTGNEIEPRPDALEDVILICDLNAPTQLPETVNAVMTDDSKQAVPVTWAWTEAQDAAAHAAGPARYEITGEAGGMPAKLYLSMVEYNYLTDYSFEDGGEGWVITPLREGDELYVEDKQTDSLTGTKHLHFWSAGRDRVEFTAEQTPAELPAGTYKFTVSIMGGDCGTTDIYAYVKLGDTIAAQAPLTINGYGSWDTAVTEPVAYDGSQPLTVGIYVKASGAGNGAWGKIDDALLNSVAAD